MTGIRDDWTFVVCDSLEKVFADQRPRPMNRDIPITAFAGESVSFQIAFLPPAAQSFDDVGAVLVEVGAAAAAVTEVASVDLVPCTLVAFEPHDDGWLRDTAGLYPDLLRPLPADGRVVPYLGQWRSVWCTVAAPPMDGELPVEVVLRSATTGRALFRTTVPVRVHPQPLPELDIVNTQWVHGDGLAGYYGVEVHSEEYWAILERFVGAAAAMGVNSVLTPVWTPPLDTAVGGTRRSVQLVDIVDDDGTYRFDFARLSRWMDLCRRQGIRHLEIAHLFTQWGAEHTPAVYVRSGSGTEQRFGWQTDATDPEYRRLLEALLPALRQELDRGWGLDRVIFHISDEPHGEAMLASYRAARAVVDDLLEGCTIVDALSDFAFYSSGVVEHPVVATDALDPFLAAEVTDLWMYYCVGQHTGVANRFIGQPSTRNRVLGSQLFRFGAAGFLHWGFNFYNAHLSTHPIDPFQDTTAGGAFLAGDPFVVYPGDDGHPWASIRYRVFAEAMADHRAMQALRDLAGTEAVLRIVDPDSTLSMTRYSDDPDHYRRVRAALTDEIVQRSS
ncbi:DUF4091 domain-containing protein [Amnibacterium sp.]|uniref:DUF4091 domain-containing protein n=1 Tax=Amnibacterium sp. TaxID=1872496 RepID=UPI002613E1E1|nr:DUF4091 domain-containing protein [Amnibacterium sp.]MCU1474273.1 hypothetical protein [Amnibacterium sp.]